jgi:hypothetical protein
MYVEHEKGIDFEGPEADYYGLNIFFANSYVEILHTNVIVLGSGFFGN